MSTSPDIPVVADVFPSSSTLIPTAIERWSPSQSDKTWRNIFLATGAAATLTAGTYLLIRFARSSSKDKQLKHQPKHKKNPPNGHANGSVKRPSLTDSGVVRTRSTFTPVDSKARLEVEENGEASTGLPALLEQEGDFITQNFSTPIGEKHFIPHSILKRRDSMSSNATTTLVFTNRSADELMLYGLESLKRAIRLFDESRTKLTMEVDDFGSVSRENSIDSELEFIISKARNLAEDVEMYVKDYLEQGELHHHQSKENMSSLEIPHDRSLGRGGRTISQESLATTLTLPFYDIEPNLHFFKLYTLALEDYLNIQHPRTDRTSQMGCETHEEFLAKVHCLRQVFEEILTEEDNVEYFSEIGKDILQIVLNHSLRDPTQCIAAYDEMLAFVADPDNHDKIAEEIAVRKIPIVSFYDLVLDYMILESFDDLENPPSAVTSVASNRWLSSGFRELALQTAVSAVVRHKRSKILVKGGFFEHFYNIIEHISPILAWGFLGSDLDLKNKCNLIKDAILNLSRSYFSFDRVRYTSLSDLKEDILRVTETEYLKLTKQLSGGQHNLLHSQENHQNHQENYGDNSPTSDDNDR